MAEKEFPASFTGTYILDKRYDTICVDFEAEHLQRSLIERVYLNYGELCAATSEKAAAYLRGYVDGHLKACSPCLELTKNEIVKSY